MMNTKTGLLWTALLFLCQLCYSQALPKKEPGATVVVKARALKDRVLLRWAVTEPAGWQAANKYGYIAERYTVLKNGKVVSAPEKKLLTFVPLKPQPQQQWATVIQQNDDAAIIAQGLFGESFQVSGGDSKLAKIVNQSDELNQRFTFSLLAADRNFAAAMMAGWGLVDSTVKQGEKYFYRIYTAVPKSKQKIDTAGIYIGVADYEPLPQPKDLYGIYGDKSVMLSWNYKLLKDVYTTYFIERSADGIHFSRLSELPIANLNEREDYTPARMFYTDTLDNNSTNYYYRIKGLTSFGETGPASETVSGSGKQVLAYVPNITGADISSDTAVQIKWEFPYGAETLLDHFELNRSADASEHSFKTVVAKIEPSERTIRFSKLLPTNYFTITAVDKNGNTRHSFPYLIQPVDSIPPSVPTGLTATIDTLGNVTLQWKANTEQDLLGYTILKSNLKTEEAAVLNSDPYTKTVFTEKISLQTLNAKVYYAVMALDQRMNQSRPCAFVELIKPDKIPPVAPVFKKYTVTDEGKVQLSWISSSSEDVAVQKLYRKGIDATDWQMIKEFDNNSMSSYEDDSVHNGATVAYTLTAVDRSNNESEPAPPLTVQVSGNIKIPAVKNLKAEPVKETGSIHISWSFENRDVVEFTVYKAVNKDPFQIWQVTGAQEMSVTDHWPSVNNMYRYAVRATLKDGRMSGWKEVKVDY